MTPVLPPHVQKALLRLGAFADDISLLTSHLTPTRFGQPSPAALYGRSKQSARSTAWKEMKKNRTTDRPQPPPERVGYADRILAQLEEYRRNRPPHRHGPAYESGGDCGRCDARKARQAPPRLASNHQNAKLNARPAVTVSRSKPRIVRSACGNNTDNDDATSKQSEFHSRAETEEGEGDGMRDESNSEMNAEKERGEEDLDEAEPPIDEPEWDTSHQQQFSEQINSCDRSQTQVDHSDQLANDFEQPQTQTDHFDQLAQPQTQIGHFNRLANFDYLQPRCDNPNRLWPLSVQHIPTSPLDHFRSQYSHPHATPATAYPRLYEHPSNQFCGAQHGTYQHGTTQHAHQHSQFIPNSYKHSDNFVSHYQNQPPQFWHPQAHLDQTRPEDMPYDNALEVQGVSSVDIDRLNNFEGEQGFYDNGEDDDAYDVDVQGDRWDENEVDYHGDDY